MDICYKGNPTDLLIVLYTFSLNNARKIDLHSSLHVLMISYASDGQNRCQMFVYINCFKFIQMSILAAFSI